MSTYTQSIDLTPHECFIAIFLHLEEDKLEDFLLENESGFKRKIKKKENDYVRNGESHQRRHSRELVGERRRRAFFQREKYS